MKLDRSIFLLLWPAYIHDSCTYVETSAPQSNQYSMYDHSAETQGSPHCTSIFCKANSPL